MRAQFHNKVFCSDDHPEMLSMIDTQRSVTYFDAGDRMTKSASEVVTRDVIQKHRPPPNKQGVHLVTMGAEEDYGFNRNADSASRKSLSQHHHTFTKYGAVYREHKNKDRKKAIGEVVFEVYNPHAKRGELIMHFDKDLAPDMAEKAASEKELSFSMSMRLPYDRCSVCDNKARTRMDYCSHLRNNIREYIPERRKYAYARNEDDVKFFDISEVEKRADRIASYLQYISSDDELMSKAASWDSWTGGEWYSAMRGDDDGAFVNVFERACLEKIAAEDIPHLALRVAPTDLNQATIDALRSYDFRALAGELNKRAMLLSPRTFAAIVTGIPIDEIRKSACCDAEIGGINERLRDMMQTGLSCCDEDLANLITPDPFGCAFAPGGDSIDRLLDGVGDSLGMKQEDIAERSCGSSFVISDTTKCASPELDSLWGPTIDAYSFYVTKAAYDLQDRLSLPVLKAALKFE